MGFGPVAFSPDGKQIASATSDNTIKLWNLTAGTMASAKEETISKYFKKLFNIPLVGKSKIGPAGL